MILVKEISQNDLEICYELDSSTIALWSMEQWESEFNKKGVKVLALYVSHEIIGICVVHVVVDEAQINYFSIHSDYLRKGYGSHLMNFLINECKQLDLKKLSLEVSEANLAANKFYKHFKFHTVGKRKNYYRNGINALLKEKIL